MLSSATAEKVRVILVEGTAAATARAHAGDIAYFCALPAHYPVPLAAVVQFVTDHLEGLPSATEQALLDRAARHLPGGKARPGPHTLSTVTRRLASLSKAHQLAGVANPCQRPELRELLARARRRQVRREILPRRKRAATRDVLDAMLATCDERLAGVRDRALLLFAFGSGGRRRSEVAAARVEDLVPVEGGYLFRLRRSKTDQAGAGVELPVVGRAGRARALWIASAGLTAGPLFRPLSWHRRGDAGISDRSVAGIVKAHAALAGYDPREFGGHSLRAGFVTTAGRQGVSLGDTMALSGHRSTAVALRYHQAGAPRCTTPPLVLRTDLAAGAALHNPPAAAAFRERRDAAGRRCAPPGPAPAAPDRGSPAASGGSWIASSIAAPRPLLVAGSTHAPEERWLITAMARLVRPEQRPRQTTAISLPRCADEPRARYQPRFDLAPRYQPRLVLAPRSIGRAAAVARLTRRHGLRCQMWSEQPGGDDWDVLVLDQLGPLAALYPGAALAFVGGTLARRGGHSPLEAAACGVPLLVGLRPSPHGSTWPAAYRPWATPASWRPHGSRCWPTCPAGAACAARC